jgi:tetratricopeptide (TPR) repeat protein
VREIRAKKEPSPGELIEQNLRNNFYRGNYNRALDNFRSILQRDDLTRGERGKAAFYAGQCSYYLSDYEKAVKYFVFSKEAESYMGMADAWIERCLGRIR